jgi:Sulfotransferase domain
MTRFILLSTQRSGSTWVTEMLESHPSVRCHGAVFLPEGKGQPPSGAPIDYFSEYVAKSAPAASRLRKQLLGWRYIDSIFASAPEAGAVGFKFMYSQFRHYPWIAPYIALKRVRIVHLVRGNKLDHVLSRMGARSRGKYHARPGEEVATPKLQVEPEELLRRLAWEETKVRRGRMILSVLRSPVLEVTYEELAADRSAFTGVLDFLGVDPQPELLRSQLQKWSRGTYEERIENYSEVRAALAGTKYEHVL